MISSFEGLFGETGAEKAGIKSGDAILSIEDKEMTSVEEVTTTLSKLGADREVRVRIRRGQREYDLPVTLSRRTVAGSAVDQVVPEQMFVRFHDKEDGNKSQSFWRALATTQLQNQALPSAIRVQRSGLDNRVADLEKEVKKLSSQIKDLTEAIERLQQGLDN